jgi:replicative DNA helicase
MSEVLHLSLPVVRWSCEAEQSVLGALLIDARALDRIRSLTADDFYSPEHAEIFRAVQSLAAARRPIDVVTVYEALEARGEAKNIGGMAYLNDIAQSVPSASNSARYADIVKDHAASRALLAAAGDALDIAKGGGDLAEKLERIAGLFGGLQRRRVRKAPRRIGEIAAERITHYLALGEGDAPSAWPTGIPALDVALNGGVRPGRVYVVAARPGIGKSSLSLQIARHLAAASLPTLVLSQEMPEDEVFDRAVAAAGRVDLGGLMSGDLEREGWDRVTEGVEALSALPLFIDDQGGLTLADVQAKARLVPGLRVLVVDYLQLCSGSANTSEANRNAQIEELSRGMKSLAKDMGVAVIELSQLNRQVEQRATKRPTLADLRDSGAVEQDADAVIFLWPVRDLGNGNQLVGCGIDKNRTGRRGVEFALHFDGAHQRWHESTEPLQQQTQGKGNSRGFD